MKNTFNFNEINQYIEHIINLNKIDFFKLKESIKKLKDKYNSKIDNLYELEKENLKHFNFLNQQKFISLHNQVIINIIKDTLKLYKDELKDLEVVFLSGSFARKTNKLSSDLDLHFFYKKDNYRYVYEEIVCYIISRVINKSRDCIDPTFIFNINVTNKNIITNMMDTNKLNIILKYKTNQIKYSYKAEKKRRFYLQYTNSRDINELFNYLNNEINKFNKEWCHCFEVIKGKSVFSNLYNKMYSQEKKLINNYYIHNKINSLKELILNSNRNIITNSISQYKKHYQSKTFEWIYEYLSIIRLILIKENFKIKYLNLIDIYNIVAENQILNKNLFIDIYQYMWNLEKLSVYCYENKINYGLHNDDKINFSTKELDDNLVVLKKEILKDLERLLKIYE